MKKGKIRVLHFLSSLNVGSGVASVIMNYWRHIDRTKIQFDFVYFIDSEKNYNNEISTLGGEIYKIEKPKIDKKSIKEIKKIFGEMEKKYDIIHNHELYLNFILEPIIRKNGITKIVTHSHTTQYSDKFISRIRNKILCIGLSNKTDCMMACSMAAGIAVYGEGKKDKIVVLNNAIKKEKFLYNKEIRKKIRIEMKAENKFVVGHVGRFNKQKNHEFLVDIFSEIKKKKENAVLILVGSGELEKKIKDRVIKLGLEKSIIFLGQRADVEEILQGMDIFILPSLYEGLPVIGVEAQAAGLPCIMANTITDEIEINKIKYMDLKKSSFEWAKETIEYYDKWKRRSVEKIIIEKGFDIEKEAEKLEKYYYEIVGNNREMSEGN